MVAAAAVMLVKIEQDASSSAAASRNTSLRKMRSVCSPEKQQRQIIGVQCRGEGNSGLEQALRLCKRAADYYPLLRQCRALWDAKRVHDHIVASGYAGETYAGNLVVQMYGKCGSVEDALAAFEGIKERNEFSWNLAIGACSNNGQARQALQLFRQMDCEGGVGPNKVTFMSIVAACSSLGAVAEARAIHARICATGKKLRNDIALGNALITMYGKWGSLADARAVFDGLVARDVITWTAMIAAYAQHGHAKDALQLFRQMGSSSVKLDKTAFVSVLGACANLGDALTEGKALHARIVETGLESDVVVANSLVNMYGKCGSMADAKSVFDSMQGLGRNVVSWNSLILVYAQNGHCEQALDLYRRMDVKKNEVTFVNVLGACCSLAEGKLVHRDILGSGLESDALVGTAVIRMYGKCGGLDDAMAAFDKIKSKTSIVAWNALLGAYAHRGTHGDEVILLFHGMYLEGVKPNGVTFITVLDACSHAGCLEQALCYFVDLLRDNGISASAEHYGCMVDILGRAGQVDKAEELILSMPFQPDAIAWMSLLGACKMHGDAKRALRAAQQLVHMEPHHGAPYLLLSSTG